MCRLMEPTVWLPRSDPPFPHPSGRHTQPRGPGVWVWAGMRAKPCWKDLPLPEALPIGPQEALSMGLYAGVGSGELQSCVGEYKAQFYLVNRCNCYILPNMKSIDE